MRRSRRWKAIGTALCVPVVLGVLLALPAGERLGLGVGEALACSGGAPPVTPDPPGFTWAKPTQVDTSGRSGVSIATDGFFALDVEGNDLSAEQAAAALVVKVEDAQGTEVSGKVRLLKERQAGWYIFSWSADAPLELGARLTARIGAEPASKDPVGGAYTLVVDGDPTPLGAHGVSLKYWADVFAPTGPTVTCAFSSTCGVSMGDVATDTIEVLGASAIWSRPAHVGDVVWEARLEPSTRTPDAVLPDEHLLYYPTFNEVETGFVGVTFPTAADTHCVTLVVEDLRTHEEVRSERCDAAEQERDVELRGNLYRCAEPPSEGTTKAWCLAHEESTLPACVAVRQGAEPEPTGTGGTTTTTTPNDGDAPEGSGPRTSRGCQLGGSAPSWPLPFVAGIALLLSQRRLRRWASRSRS